MKPPDAARKKHPGASAPAFDIAWHRRLSTKMVALTALVCTGALTWSIATEYLVERQRIDGLVGVATVLSETIRSATRNALRDNRKSDAYETMETIGRQLL
jgi:hypothetical protein